MIPLDTSRSSVTEEADTVSQQGINQICINKPDRAHVRHHDPSSPDCFSHFPDSAARARFALQFVEE
jgi:hypothetical protein